MGGDTTSNDGVTPTPSPIKMKYFIKFKMEGIEDSIASETYNSFLYISYSTDNPIDSASSPINFKKQINNFINYRLQLILPCDSSLMHTNLNGKRSLIRNPINLPTTYPFSDIFQIEVGFNTNLEYYISLPETSISTYFNDVTSIKYEDRNEGRPCFSIKGRCFCRVINCNDATDMQNLTVTYCINNMVKEKKSS
jgi:hypothetical protein